MIPSDISNGLGEEKCDRLGKLGNHLEPQMRSLRPVFGVVVME